MDFRTAYLDWSPPNNFKGEGCLSTRKQYPIIVEEIVTDSSFYCVIWFQDDTGHSAFTDIYFIDQVMPLTLYPSAKLLQVGKASI
ncbi:hypothetical protein GH733_009184 [Mirounga leonina]|nr:hypothetical protein GH733_009184 [Mirounga leonina]